MLPLHPRGKGIWIRRISDCENGELDTIVAKAEAAHYRHVFIRIADGSDLYNFDPITHHDQAVALTVRLHAAGLDVWGWHYLYGDKPLFKGPPLQANYHLREAECAVRRVKRLQAAGLRGYVIDAEGEYKRIPDRAEKAAQFMETVRQGLGDFPIALTSWKQPNAHRSFPWQAFRSRCDLDLPQVFWIGRHGEAAKQLEASLKQFAALQPQLPYFPAGPAFFEANWRPSPEEITAFLEKALDLGLPAASLWNWDHLGLTGEETTGNSEGLDFRPHWQAAADFVWRAPKPTEDGRRTTEEVPVPEAVPVISPEPTLEHLTLVPPEAEDELPDWLQFLNQSEPDMIAEAISQEPEPVVMPEAEDELPEWLQFLNEPETEATAQPAPALEPEPVLTAETEGELPEWLQFLNEPETPGAPVTTAPIETELAPPVAQETEAELPEWLQFHNQPKPELPFETPASPAELAAEPALAFSSELMPEVSQPRLQELPPADFVSIPSTARSPKPIFFTPPAQLASPQGFQLPKRAAARVTSAPSMIPRGDTVSQLFDALRNGEPELAVTFYGSGFVHVNNDRVERDPAALAGFYKTLLQEIQGRELAWSVMPVAHAVVSATWNVLTHAGKPLQGTDTFHLNHIGQIVYHHTAFQIDME